MPEHNIPLDEDDTAPSITVCARNKVGGFGNDIHWMDPQPVRLPDSIGIEQLARMNLGEVEEACCAGRIPRSSYEGYALAWNLLSPYRDRSQIEIPADPNVRETARKLIVAKGFEVPAELLGTEQAGRRLRTLDEIDADNRAARTVAR